MIKATVKTFHNYLFYIIFDPATSIVKSYCITNGISTYTFYSYTKANRTFAEMMISDNKSSNKC